MIFRKKPVLVTFEEARKVLLVMLADVGEEFWRGKLASVSSESFKNLLGGMGSLNDLIICVENGHRVADEKQPLANELLSCLTDVCYATVQRGPLPTADAVAACRTEGEMLHGCRCLACGHAQVSVQNIRAFDAHRAVREALKNGIDAVLQLWKNLGDAESIQRIGKLASLSGIHVMEEKRWMRPCLACNSDDTCVYRWQLARDSFRPTSDNLPLKG